jgi:formate dehydrogenase maturation protein FdhE
MTKCPNCGSTAQIQKQGQVEGNETIIRKMVCGCGCEFLQYFTLKKDLSKITKKPKQ